MTRYRWVAARKVEGFPITMACVTASVSRQAFHDWRARETAGPSVAEQAETELVELMWEIHAESDSTYGEPRMTSELARRGRPVNHKRVGRLMRTNGIVGVFKRAKVRTTIPAENIVPLPDLVGRRFDPGRCDVVWCGDITYIPTAWVLLVKAGCISRRCSISGPAGCWDTRWPHTCAPASSRTRSPWQSRHAVLR